MTGERHTAGWALVAIAITIGVGLLAVDETWLKILLAVLAVVALALGVVLIVGWRRRSELRIVRAHYGAEGCPNGRDVTAVVQSRATSHDLRMIASNEEVAGGGDPCPYMRKALLIDYTLGGKAQPQVAFRENDVVELPLPADWQAGGPRPEGLTATPHFEASEAERNVADFLVWAGNLIAAEGDSASDGGEWAAEAKDCLDGVEFPLADSLSATTSELEHLLRNFREEPVANAPQGQDDVSTRRRELRQARARLARVVQQLR
jgi:hypothetical protein